MFAKNISVMSVMVGLLLLVGLAACQDDSPATEPDQSFVTFHDGALGLTLQYPEEWITHTSISGLTLATNQSVVDRESLAEIGDDAFVIIVPGELGVFNAQTGQDLTSDDSLRALEVYRGLLSNQGQNYTELEEPRMIEVDDHQIAIWPLESRVEGKNLVVLLAIAMGDDYMALVSAGSVKANAEKYEPLFEHIISTIRVEAATP